MTLLRQMNSEEISYERNENHIEKHGDAHAK